MKFMWNLIRRKMGQKDLKARGEAVGMTAELHTPLNMFFRIIDVEGEDEIMEAVYESMPELPQETLKNGMRIAYRAGRHLGLKVSSDVRDSLCKVKRIFI